MKLKRDITSTKLVKGVPLLYGKKGEKVTIIDDRGNVLIVEANGKKFSVSKEDVI